jgi:hypothetical protein
MKNGAAGFAGFVGLLSLCLTAPAFGQAAIVDFTNAPDGIYDPYQGTVTIGGVTVNNGLIVCDDDNHEISQPESWNATAILVSSLNAGNIGNTFFGTMGSAIGLQGYAEIAAIANALLTGQTSLDGVTGLNNVDLSQALWLITHGSNPGNIGTITSNATALDTALALNTTAADVSLYSNLYVLTPDSGTGYQINGESYPYGTPQEMFALVPEGGAASLYLLLAGVACFGAMRLNSRSQFASRIAA